MLPTMPRLAVRSTCSSCTTPCCMRAARVSCGVKLMRKSSVMERSAKGRKSGGEAKTLEQCGGVEQGQAHDAGVAALEVFDEHRRAALDAVGAGLVHGLAGGDVA